MDQVLDWIYGQLVGFLGDFFAQMGNMGVELFDMPWVQSIVLFFSYLGWALYVVGLVVSCFECGIEYQAGRGGSIKDTALDAIKGFLLSTCLPLPVELFRLAVDLQSLTAGITGYGSGIILWLQASLQVCRMGQPDGRCQLGSVRRSGGNHQSYSGALHYYYDGICGNQGIFLKP